MKKTLTTIALALGLTVGINCINSQTSERGIIPLEKKVVQEGPYPGFSKIELDMIKEANEIINRQYQAQRIIFLENKDIAGVGKSAGRCRDNKEYLAQNFDYDNFGDYFLVLLRDYTSHEEEFKKEKNTEFNKKWIVPYHKPMVNTVIHETGHTYYDSLTQEEKEKLARVFWEVDKTVTEDLKGKPVRGHASFYSYFYWISPEADMADALKYSNEQFAEIFTYLVLGHKYMNHDKEFMKKLEAVRQVMERFKK